MTYTDKINEALVKYNYAETSTQQLAEHMGFSTEEQRMLTMFWEPAFNGSWIYLSDEIILGQLTNEKGKDALKDFYNRTLLANDYVENIDYKKISKNDELLEKYENFYSAILPNRKTSNRKLYYAVSGETYKDLLQKSANKKGKTTRQYYRKVEQLAIFMKDYISALHKHILETKLAEKDKVIEDNKESLNRINRVNLELLTFKKLNERNESIYIVATYRYATQGIFKVGRTKCMKARTSGHNTTHIAGDKVKVLKEFKVNDSVATENYIHRKLKGLLVRDEKEFFMCPYDLLEKIIEVIISNDDAHNNLINSIIDTVYQLKCSNYSIEHWMNGIDTAIFREEYHLVDSGDEVKVAFDVTSATEAQKKAFVAQCVQAYKITIEEPNKIMWKTFQAFLITQLKLPKSKYKALEWKPMFNEATTSKPS